MSRNEPIWLFFFFCVFLLIHQHHHSLTHWSIAMLARVVRGSISRPVAGCGGTALSRGMLWASWKHAGSCTRSHRARCGHTSRHPEPSTLASTRQHALCTSAIFCRFWRWRISRAAATTHRARRRCDGQYRRSLGSIHRTQCTRSRHAHRQRRGDPIAAADVLCQCRPFSGKEVGFGC